MKAVKNLFREKSNIIIFLLALILITNSYQIFLCANGFDKIHKKINHRYFATIKFFEEKYNVEIDTKTGEIKKIRG